MEAKKDVEPRRLSTSKIGTYELKPRQLAERQKPRLAGYDDQGKPIYNKAWTFGEFRMSPEQYGPMENTFFTPIITKEFGTFMSGASPLTPEEKKIITRHILGGVKEVEESRKQKMNL
jgi:hypothetical protein